MMTARNFFRNLSVSAVGLLLALSPLALPPPAGARPVRMWSPDELAQKADLIVVATVRSTGDANPTDTSRAKAETWVPVRSVFDVQAVLKGRLSGKTVTVEHFRYFGRSAETLVRDGPAFVEFSPAKKNQYLIYLKKGPGSSYEPLSGQEDPWISFSWLQPYHVTHERPGPGPAPSR